MPLPRGTVLLLKKLRHVFRKTGMTVRLLTTKAVGTDVETMSRIRNIGIIAHIDAGKTTTTERMLFYSGYSNHLGDVDRGDTVMDYMEQERDRGITINSAVITFHWAKHKINLIDTPGHVDFTVEVERSLRVLDGAVTILDASAGVEAQTLTVWRQADRYHVPRLVYLNKMDKPGASLPLSLASLEQRLHVTPLLLNLPVGAGKQFSGVKDLVNMTLLEWNDNISKDGSVYKITPLDLNQSDPATEDFIKARTDLIGKLADVDERVADLVLCDTKIEDFPVEDLMRAVRTGTLKRQFIPVLCGSSLKNKGVQPLLNAVVSYLPSPMDINYGFAKYYGNHFCALAFKVQHDRHRGSLAFIRIYTGMISSGSSVYNINRNSSEKCSRLLQVYADELHEVSNAVAGNIVAVAGLKETYTGDTLTASSKTAAEAARAYVHDHNLVNSGAAHTHVETKDSEFQDDQEEERLVESDTVTKNNVPVLAGVSVPQPVFFCSVETMSLMMQKDLDKALELLQKEDPSLKVEVNQETGQTILSGMGELHLDIVKSRLQKEFGLEVDLGPLQIAYKETIQKDAEVTETFDKELAGSRQFVHLKISVHPDLDERFFKHVVLRRTQEHPLVITHKQLTAIERGIKSGLSHGSLLNFPVIHTSVHLHEFEVHYHTTLPMITGCVALAVQKALKVAGSSLLEPMMALEINTDEDRLDAVLSDLSQRRSHILSVSHRHDVRIISALTPLQELRGYATHLRTITSGTATFTMELSHYEQTNAEETQNVMHRLLGFRRDLNK